MTKQFLGAKRLRELLRLAHAGWGFQDCRELAAHFAWIWERDAELPEAEIRDKLRELNACFYQPFILPEETERAIDTPTPVSVWP